MYAVEIRHDRIDDAQWDSYVCAHPDATVYHVRAWGRIASESYGIEDHSLTALRNGAIVGVLPVFRAHRLSGSPYLTTGIFGAYNGVLADDPQIRELLIHKVKSLFFKTGASFLVIKDLCQHEYPGFSIKREYVTFVMNLDNGIAPAWSLMKDKARNQARKAERAGLHFVHDNNCLSEFAAVYERNMRDMGTPFLGMPFLKSVMRNFGERADIVLVRHGSITVAGGIMLRFRDRAYLPFASSLKKFNHLCCNNMLYWEAIKFACAHGCRAFDFGRSTVESGTYRFKKQWGASPQQLLYKYFPAGRGETFNPNDAKYRILAGLWRFLPVRIGSVIGPAIVRHLV